MTASAAKRCYGCNTIKPRTAEHFRRDASKPDGLHSKCKACERIYMREVYRPKTGRAKDIARAKARRAERQQNQTTQTP